MNIYTESCSEAYQTTNVVHCSGMLLIYYNGAFIADLHCSSR